MSADGPQGPRPGAGAGVVNVVILHDGAAATGRPDEQDVRVQVELVADALRASGHVTWELAVDLDLERTRRALTAGGAELAVNLVEAVHGHGRLIHLVPALLDAMDLPYTGAPTEAMFLTSHKTLCKRLLLQVHESTPPWIEGDGSAHGAPTFPGRFLVKSVWEDASLGLDDEAVVDVDDAFALGEAIQRFAPAMGGEAFGETWVEGREFNVALLEIGGSLQVLPVAEMRFVDYPEGKPTLVGYRAKWDGDSFEAHHTVRRFGLPAKDRVLRSRLEDTALRVCERFGLTGYARVDFRVDAQGRPWILELNPNPCLSPDAGFMAAASRAGITPDDVVDALVHGALARARPRHPRRGPGVVITHGS